MMSTGRFNPFQCDFAKLEVRSKIEIMYTDEKYSFLLIYYYLARISYYPYPAYLCFIVEAPKKILF